MGLNERERQAWGRAYEEKANALLQKVEAEGGRGAVEKLALLWAEQEEEWLRANRPEHILLKLLDEKRKEANQ